MAVDAGPDPYAIFARTRTAVTSAPYPDSLGYTIAVTGLDGSTPRSDHYRAYSRPAEGVVDVAAVSQEEAAHPPVIPHGANFSLTAFLCGGRCETGSATMKLPVGDVPGSPDLIGVPILDPTYTFGIGYRTPGEAAENTSGLRVIASVSTLTRTYAIVLDGIALIDGVPSYHLILKPLRRPHDNRLRELWVGTQDYLPRRAVIAGNFTIAPLVDVPWTVDFTVLGGAPVISQERTDATLYLSHRRIVRDAVIAFAGFDTSAASLVSRPIVQPQPSGTALVEPKSP